MGQSKPWPGGTQIPLNVTVKDAEGNASWSVGQ